MTAPLLDEPMHRVNEELVITTEYQFARALSALYIHGLTSEQRIRLLEVLDLRGSELRALMELATEKANAVRG